MNHRFIVLFLCLLQLTIFALPQQSQIQAIDKMMKKYSKHHLFSGVLLLADDKGIQLNSAYIDQEIKQPAYESKNALFQIGSISQLVIAQLIYAMEKK